MAIPMKIEHKLSDQVWKRSNRSVLGNAFHELGVPPSDPFREFYASFQGPFRSGNSSYELLDIIDQEESIIANTRIVREEFEFPPRYVVLTSMNGLAALVYDLETGGVFDVDFEGSDKLLVEGQLAPRWPSWWEFAVEYFS